MSPMQRGLRGCDSISCFLGQGGAKTRGKRGAQEGQGCPGMIKIRSFGEVHVDLFERKIVFFHQVDDFSRDSVVLLHIPSMELVCLPT